MADDQREVSGPTPAPTPWYEESWAVVTAGAGGLIVIGVLIFAVMQTSENSVEPSYGPQYPDYSASTTSSSATTTSRTTRSSTTTTTASETTTSETSETTTSDTTTSETTTSDEEESSSTQATLDDENPFILNPFATTTTTSENGSNE